MSILIYARKAAKYLLRVYQAKRARESYGLGMKPRQSSTEEIADTEEVRK